MKKSLICFLIILLSANLIRAQIIFNKNYDIDSTLDGVISVIQTLDGGYIAGGVCDDLSTGSSSAFLFKTNESGDTLWTKIWDFSPPGGDQIRSVIQLNDSSYMGMGNTYNTVAMNWDVFLLKLTPFGDTLWMKTYSIGTGIDLGYMLKKTTDGGFIIAGRTTSNTSGPEDAYWIKTDSAGNLQWQYQYGGSNIDAAYSVDLATDGGYILGGHTYSYGAGGGDMMLIKINNAGIFQWRKTFGTTGNDYGETAIATLDGGYAISGAVDDGTGTVHGHIVKTDNSGNMQWNKTFGYWGGYESLNVVRQLQDSSYILTGSTYLNASVEEQGWLLKINSIGDSLWSRTYGGTTDLPDYLYTLDLADDGGFIVAGYDNRIGPPYQNIWLIKTDCMGNDSVWDTINCSLATSITDENVIESNSIKIYPNPNNGDMQFEYDLSGFEKGEFSIYDITGRMVVNYTLSSGKKVMNISETTLHNGIYFYIYKVNDAFVKSEKIIIVK